MASSVTSSRIYDRRADNMYYVAPTVTNDYMVHGSVLFDMRDFKAIGAKLLKVGTQTNSMTVGIGVSTASAATAYTIVRTGSTAAAVNATASIEVDVDELAALGSGFRYAAVYVAAATTHAGNLAAVHVSRDYPKRAYDGLTAEQTASTAAVTGTGS